MTIMLSVLLYFNAIIYSTFLFRNYFKKYEIKFIK